MLTSSFRVRVVLVSGAVLSVLALGPGAAWADTPSPNPAPTCNPTTFPPCIGPTTPPPSPSPTASPTPSPTPRPTPSPTHRATHSPRPRATFTAAPGTTESPVTATVGIGGLVGDSPTPTTEPSVATVSRTSKSGSRLGLIIGLVIGGGLLLGIAGATGLYLTRHPHEH